MVFYRSPSSYANKRTRKGDVDFYSTMSRSNISGGPVNFYNFDTNYIFPMSLIGY